MTRARMLPGAAALALLACAAVAAEEFPSAERRSGSEFMSRETQAMQRDDTANPGMLFVGDGEAAWNRKQGTAGLACADCHGNARISMHGVAAGYPAFEPGLGRPINIEQRINLCRETRQSAVPLAWESPELLALTAFVAHQSRGLPVSPPDDERLAPFRARGQALFRRRLGQLNFSCAQCHSENWGKRLGSAPIPQAHPTGYPIYRLEWQALGSLQRRLRNCLIGMRAEPYPYGAPEYVDLELFLNWRARGMPGETPGVRP